MTTKTSRKMRLEYRDNGRWIFVADVSAAVGRRFLARCRDATRWRLRSVDDREAGSCGA